MAKSLKIYFTVLFLSGFSVSFCQPLIDHAVINQYDSIYKRLPARFHKSTGNRSEDTGLALFTENYTDTLNKNDQKSSSTEEIELIQYDSKSDKPVKQKKKKREKEMDYDVSWCAGISDHDSLFIQIDDLFFGHAVFHLISRNTVSTYYAEFAKYDTVYKMTESDTLKNYLNIPAQTIRFTLSDDHFITGKMYYGSAEILTGPYYKLDLWKENSYYHLQRRMKYYFKFRLESKDQRF